MKGSRYWLIALALVFVITLAACAAPAEPAPAPERPTPTTPAPQAPTPTAPSSLYEAAKKEGEISFWTHSLQDSELFLKFFESKYPSVKLKVWDARSPDLIAKVTEEAKVGKFSVDVISVPDLDMNHLKDLLVVYDWPATRDWEQLYKPSHNLWRFYGSAPKLPVYNTDLVSAAEAPKTLDDLKNTKWRGRSINSTSNDQLPLIYAWLWGEGGKLNWDKSLAFWQEVVDNTRPRVMSGFEGAVGLVTAGDVVLHQMSSLTTYFRYKWKGAPIALVALDQVPSTMWAVAIAKNAPHPNAARLFADFFTSAEAQVFFANGQGALASSPEAARKAKPNLELVEKGLKIFIAPPEVYTVENTLKAQEFWSKAMRGR
ncbi:MAG: hypothetical protein HW414_952 [Dehalococcoidia bacterium]|nr:hypothetical protein [Dehalococcoidia bacterium]